LPHQEPPLSDCKKRHKPKEKAKSEPGDSEPFCSMKFTSRFRN
jgi:hypothetical protein